MKRLFILILFFTCAAHAQQKITWPHHKKSVIVLTYDDGLNSQLNIAIPQLDSAKLPATFFLCGDLNYVSIPKWRAVSKKGFELANHTIYHPCVSTDDNPVASGNYTPYTIVREIGTMNNLLYAVDGKTARTYAYPCTETTVGGKSYVIALKKSGLIKYARVGGDVDAVITDFKNLDPLLVPAYGLNGNNTGAELIAFVKRVQVSGGMGIFMFHGIGGDYISTPAASHRQLLAYLKKHKKEIWIATFQQAMDYISQQEHLK
ncbi:MAG: Polysaccharide deacetylase [Mucilaginibacter sp.]|jgi:peptidoglycan/xylan/chitin deacetylase (PgdA/CDA1 family)|nr:Polysaccharide deacetylase [Mucilaginibacter sp.]